MSTAAGLPDLLRRFVATPYRFGAVLHSMVIEFETNDQELLTTVTAQAEPLAYALVSPTDTYWHWKLVRDYQISEERQDTCVLMADELSVLFIGTATVVAVDWQRCQLLGFIPANGLPRTVLDILLQRLGRHRRAGELKPSL